MKLKNISIGIFTLSLLAALGYLLFAPAGLQAAPAQTFKIIDGRSLELTALQGKPVLITFWATSCPGCVKEIPHLITLYEEFNPHGLEIIGVAMADDLPNRVLEMHKRKRIPYPIALDVDSSAALAFGDVHLTPTSFLIDPQGRIVKHKIGELDIPALRQQIKSMLPPRQKG